MSPSEFDLRGALHDGEGEGIDVEALIGRAAEVRHARRVRWATAASVVAVAAGIGTALAVTNTPSSTHRESAASVASAGPTTAGPAGAAGSAARPEVNSPPQAASAGGYADSTGAALCAATWPEQSALLSAHAEGSLFAHPVVTVLVCGYDQTRHLAHLPDGGEVSATFTAANASTIATSLEFASLHPLPVACALTLPPVRFLSITAVYRSGQQAALVSATTTCGGIVSNGSAQRYAWNPPSPLVPLINETPPFAR